MKRFITLIVLVCLVGINAFAQSYKVRRAFAFYQDFMHGMAMVDLDGNPSGPNMHTDRFLYIETAGQITPVIKSVIWNGKLYNASIFKAEGQTVNVGKRNSNWQGIVLQAAKGYNLWKIELSEPAKENKYTQRSFLNKVIIRGSISNHPFSYVIDRMIELMRVEGV